MDIPDPADPSLRATLVRFTLKAPMAPTSKNPDGTDCYAVSCKVHSHDDVDCGGIVAVTPNAADAMLKEYVYRVPHSVDADKDVVGQRAVLECEMIRRAGHVSMDRSPGDFAHKLELLSRKPGLEVDTIHLYRRVHPDKVIPNRNDTLEAAPPVTSIFTKKN